MKHIWIMSLVLLAWPIGSLGLQRALVLIEDPSGRQVGLYRESHALLIGVSKYTGRWPSLPGVKRDLEVVKAALERHGGDQLQPQHTASPVRQDSPSAPGQRRLRLRLGARAYAATSTAGAFSRQCPGQRQCAGPGVSRQ